MKGAALKPLPPPPLPRGSDGENEGDEGPTFIDRLYTEEKLQAETRRQDKQAKYTSQCLFPSHIPRSLHCKNESLLSLVSKFDELREGREDEQLCPNTATSDFKDVISLCSTYKTRALKNRDEFEFKKAKLQQQKQAAEGVDTAEIDLPAQPQASEFTSLSAQENSLLASIHAANYNLCLGNAICPDRTAKLMTCWRRTDSRVIQQLKERRLDRFVCWEERKAVERCLGNSVQRVMKDIER